MVAPVSRRAIASVAVAKEVCCLPGRVNPNSRMVPRAMKPRTVSAIVAFLVLAVYKPMAKFVRLIINAKIRPVTWALVATIALMASFVPLTRTVPVADVNWWAWSVNVAPKNPMARVAMKIPIVKVDVATGLLGPRAKPNLVVDIGVSKIPIVLMGTVVGLGRGSSAIERRRGYVLMRKNE